MNAPNEKMTATHGETDRISQALVIGADPVDADQPSEAGYTEWLRERLQKTIAALNSGEMKSYSNETAKAVLHARLEARRSKLHLTA